MPLFSSNKHTQNDGTLNTHNNTDTTTGTGTGSNMRENEYDQYPNTSDRGGYDNNNLSGGGAPQTGGMYNNERGMGTNQGYDNTSGNGFGETRAERRAERANEMPLPMSGQTSQLQQQHHHHHGGNTGAGVGTAGSGGFISQSHSDQLGRDAEIRRQQRETQFTRGGGNTNTDEYNAMGFDSPPSGGGNNNNLGNTNTNTGTSTGMGTGMGSGLGNNNISSPPSGGGSGMGGGNIPHNSLSLKEQAEQKARESESMQKQAVEVGKAEELEKAAMAARQRAVEHGAHPLHGHPGGIEASRRGQA